MAVDCCIILRYQSLLNLSPQLVCFQCFSIVGSAGVNIFVQIRVMCWVFEVFDGSPQSSIVEPKGYSFIGAPESLSHSFPKQ